MAAQIVFTVIVSLGIAFLSLVLRGLCLESWKKRKKPPVGNCLLVERPRGGSKEKPQTKVIEIPLLIESRSAFQAKSVAAWHTINKVNS